MTQCLQDSESVQAELQYTADVLATDAKNYHAWSHRQWLVQSASKWDGEITFVNGLLDQDARNNSAWNHRWFCISRGSSLAWTTETLLEEVSAVHHRVKSGPSLNEAAWNYLGGLLRAASDRKAAIDSASAHALITSAAQAALDAAATTAEQPASDAARSPPSNAHVVQAAALHVLRYKLETASDMEEHAGLSVEWLQCCEALAKQDVTRSRYWTALGKAPPAKV